MIVRVSEASVRTERFDEFMEILRELVAGFPAAHDGLLGHEILVDRANPTRVQYVSRWRDEEAVRAFAGDGWADTPVTFPDEDAYLTEPLRLRHFVVDDFPTDVTLATAGDG
ncbi:putative quinol monooxygenase [Myceligenerans pegani]|uniref:Antibiotic biosynthesis monooxygenase n=1 Tax=Myceligenerans pegani TaxID=2776917 RepID=A0ABR9MWX0_9MICO|nr:antibiotic biosynthesis monooxygenase family protein [Myceligenerans sp. TRM 65318]MBE1875424.1 antibiotic biosynthesis monooxygenase [Myceligenerans sp. TRM 65318]MBE3017695.1 antibiotic biosynthesis monooxygenase [Myceligenerans sp. TRM 65318]